MTVNVWPATVSVAVRDTVVGFAAAAKATTPVPLPAAPDVTVSQDALLDAVQAHPLVDVTLTEPVPPAAPSAWLVAESVYAHGGITCAACVNLSVCPPIVSVPVRGLPVVLAVMLIVTVPLPVPFAPAPTVSHDASLAAVHGHPPGAVTESVPVPAAEVSDWVVTSEAMATPSPP